MRLVTPIGRKRLTYIIGDVGLIHQLQLRREELCKLCKTWKAALRPIPFNTDGLPHWGPSEDDLDAVRIEDAFAKTGTKPVPQRRDEEEDGGDDDAESEAEEEEDEVPIDEIEAFQRAHAYAEETDDYYLASGDLPGDGGEDDDEQWFAQ